MSQTNPSVKMHARVNRMNLSLLNLRGKALLIKGSEVYAKSRILI